MPGLRNNPNTYLGENTENHLARLVARLASGAVGLFAEHPGVTEQEASVARREFFQTLGKAFYDHHKNKNVSYMILDQDGKSSLQVNYCYTGQKFSAHTVSEDGLLGISLCLPTRLRGLEGPYVLERAGMKRERWITLEDCSSLDKLQTYALFTHIINTVEGRIGNPEVREVEFEPSMLDSIV